MARPKEHGPEADDVGPLESPEAPSAGVTIPQAMMGESINQFFLGLGEELADLRSSKAVPDTEEARILAAYEKANPSSRRPLCPDALIAKHSPPPLLGDLFGKCIEDWVKLVTGGNRHEAEGLTKRIDQMMAEMEAEGMGTMAERLLIQAVMVQWVQMHFFEAAQASAPDTNMEVADFKLRRTEGALRKFTKAVEGLAKIRTIPIRPKTLVVQQAVLPNEAPTPCIDVASSLAGLQSLPARQCAAIENTLHQGDGFEFPKLSASSLENADMALTNRRDKKLGTHKQASRKSTKND